MGHEDEGNVKDKNNNLRRKPTERILLLRNFYVFSTFASLFMPYILEFETFFLVFIIIFFLNRTQYCFNLGEEKELLLADRIFLIMKKEYRYKYYY